jgi:hypothetical protein
MNLEIKIFIYILAITLILRLIVLFKYENSSLNWKYFLKEESIGVAYYLMSRGLLIYLVLRLIIIPITIWWF